MKPFSLALRAIIVHVMIRYSFLESVDTREEEIQIHGSAVELEVTVVKSHKCRDIGITDLRGQSPPPHTHTHSQCCLTDRIHLPLNTKAINSLTTHYSVVNSDFLTVFK